MRRFRVVGNIGLLRMAMTVEDGGPPARMLPAPSDDDDDNDNKNDKDEGEDDANSIVVVVV